MISKTKINERIRRKTNQELVETIELAKKNNLLELAKGLSAPRRLQSKVNLDEIDREAKDGETILIPGKVLGNGNINKKIKIIALSFSSAAKEKLKKAECETKTIKEELEKNKSLKGVRVLG